MANLNRLKIVLVEQNKTGKWLAEQLGKLVNGAATLYSQIYTLWRKLQNCST